MPTNQLVVHINTRCHSVMRKIKSKKTSRKSKDKTWACSLIDQNQITIYGIQFESDNPGIIYHAMGVNGADLPSYLKCNLMQKQTYRIRTWWAL